MRFSTIFLAIASLGAAYAAVEQPAAGADKLAKREEFREAVKRAAEPVAQDGWGGNGGWGGAVFADGYCDADNDCPRLCRNQFGNQFNDEGTKCCFNKCSCAGGCQGSGSKYVILLIRPQNPL
ncbi:hypothetical protein SLS56_004453 [Neofusicoccum ribis]|uniref:Uncharacterized protein n=1 Tax=Neofusicoccum ribis TaxID=45134 RepID=A0ABR3SWC8_9PEZI